MPFMPVLTLPVKPVIFFSVYPMAPSKPALMVFVTLLLSFAAAPMDFPTADPKLSASRPISRKLSWTSSAPSPRSSRASSASLAPSTMASVPARKRAPMSWAASSASSAVLVIRSRRSIASLSFPMASSSPKSMPKVSSRLSATGPTSFLQKDKPQGYPPCGLLHTSL